MSFSRCSIYSKLTLDEFLFFGYGIRGTRTAGKVPVQNRAVEQIHKSDRGCLLELDIVHECAVEWYGASEDDGGGGGGIAGPVARVFA